MNRFETRNAFLFRLAALLLLGVLLTMRLFAGLPARFSSSATGPDDVGIALYAVSTAKTAGNTKMEFTKGTAATKTYSFKVRNYTANDKICEVAMKYSIRITMPNTPNNSFTISKMTKGGTDITSKLTKNGNIYTYTDNANKFTAGTKTDSPEYVVTVSFTGNIGNFTYVDVNAEALSSSVSIDTTALYTASVKIDVISEQID